MVASLQSQGLSRGPSLADQAYEALKRQIIEGVIAGNAVVSENELSRQLAISRSPLREAIRKLQDEMLLEESGPRGIRVPPISTKFVRDLYNLRRALEVEAARLADFPDSETMRRAWQRHDEVRVALCAGDSSLFTARDFEFHDLYIRACGNDLLITHIERLRGPVARVHAFANPLVDHIEVSASEHEKILRALDSKSRSELCRAVEAHVDGVAKRLAQYIAEAGTA